jgi:hypothetical protein
MAYMKPPSAGPLMVANCMAPLDSAVPCCNMCMGTTPVSMAAPAGRSKAVAAPKIAEAMKICVTDSQPPMVPQARNAAVRPSIHWQICTTRLRLKWSAACPAKKVSAAVGRNWINPTMPSWKALPVS